MGRSLSLLPAVGIGRVEVFGLVAEPAAHLASLRLGGRWLARRRRRQTRSGLRLALLLRLGVLLDLLQRFIAVRINNREIRRARAHCLLPALLQNADLVSHERRLALDDGMQLSGRVGAVE